MGSWCELVDVRDSSGKSFLHQIVCTSGFRHSVRVSARNAGMRVTMRAFSPCPSGMEPWFHKQLPSTFPVPCSDGTVTDITCHTADDATPDVGKALTHQDARRCSRLPPKLHSNSVGR